MDLRAGLDVAQRPTGRAGWSAFGRARPGMARAAGAPGRLFWPAHLSDRLRRRHGRDAYDAMRHLLFVIPPLAVLSSAGWLRTIEATSGGARLLIAAVLVAGVVEPLGFQWRNHPNQIAYVQPLAGGPQRPSGATTSTTGAIACSSRWSGWRESIGAAGAGHRVAAGGVADEREPVSHVGGRGGGRGGGAPATELVFRPTYSIELVRGRREHVRQLATMPDVVDRVTTADGALLCVTRAAAKPLPQALFDRRNRVPPTF